MAERESITKPKSELYETTDEMMCEVLMMAGHNARSVLRNEEGFLVYAFDVGEVWPTVEAILTGAADKLTFSYMQWWKARITWQMNLRHSSRSRKVGG